jgi:signal transduction histidine kinase
MASIKGYVQMLSRGSLGEITEEQEKSLEIVLRNINRLDRLIQDILDLSQLESGTMEFVPEETDLQKMIDEVTETMRSSADIKDIKIGNEVEEQLPHLTIDPERIKQVIINLTNNAIKFSPDGSVINLKVKKEQENVLFEVEDFGRGIPKDKQERVFETFYQVDSGMKRSFGGAGLGLSISKDIILAHEGKIWVESEGIPGKGSTFRFTLPIKSVKDIEERFKGVDKFKLENEI